MKKIILSVFALSMLLYSCTETTEVTEVNEIIYNTSSDLSFTKIGSFTNGPGEAYAEISAYDPITKKLFVVNPEDNEISVLDLSNPRIPSKLVSIILNGSPNSVAVKNGILAVAIENFNKQADGTIATYNTSTQMLIQSYPAGALPDMVTFSPDGNYIVCANEGEPSDDYSIDPEGSITIIHVSTNTVSQVTFQGQTNPGNNFRVYGNNGTSSFAQDVEPEYVTISDDSKYAYVSLQENNGMVKINLTTKSIEKIFGLGVKDFNLIGNEIDASDKDNMLGNFQNWNVLSYFQPDAIDYFTVNQIGYIVSANEGDSRDYSSYSEEKRVKDVVLDPVAYPNAAFLQLQENLGRLKMTTANGDTDNDGDFDQIYGYGGRSFSIWNTNGDLVYDSGNEIGLRTFNIAPTLFNQNDGRSDDKGAEPESVKTMKIGEKVLLFIGLERTNGIMVYDISNVQYPQFIAWLNDSADIAPEGLIVVEKENSPTGNALIIATNEVSSTIAIYEMKEL